MPESRDRLSRQDDVISTRIGGRRIIGGASSNSEVIIMDDDVEDRAAGTPFRWRGAPMVGMPRSLVVAHRRGGFGSPRFGRSPNFGRSSALVIGQENLSPPVGSSRGRGVLRGRRSLILPAWYPRKPLRDITAVVRAIERRARGEGGEGLETESPILQDQIVHDPSVSTPVAQLEQDLSMTSPFPTIGDRRCPPTIGRVPKILLNITNQRDEEDSACLTPQKKLLNNLEAVERVVMEELHKLKRTPSAKKDERQKRVKTLMSMR